MSQKLVCLALQGGGSHGAYTWGVLDRLLESDGIAIEAVSGASAGAVNATVLAHGYLIGGRDGAREALERFWTAVSEKTLAGAASGAFPEPATKTYLSLTRYFSPYQLNPLNVNPLRDILAAEIDFERLRSESRIKLFISATRVRDGALRMFTHRDLTLDALLASACVPSVHHSVEIDGEAYWDGGLAANPPLSDLVYTCRARDVLVVVLTPPGTSEAPSSADAIFERFTQISFSSTLATELHSIALAKAAADRTLLAFGTDRRLKALKVHLIQSADYMATLDPATRFKTDAAFMTELRAEGRERAEEWLHSGRRGLRNRVRPELPHSATLVRAPR